MVLSLPATSLHFAWCKTAQGRVVEASIVSNDDHLQASARSIQLLDS